MIEIHSYLDDPDTLKQEALTIFRQQWALYRRIVDNDFLNHRQAVAALRQALQARPPDPLRLIDVACGDARTTLQALEGLPISHYRGIDLSRPALELAAANLTPLAAHGCELRLEQRDFSTALRDCPASADVIWLGLSLHHLTRDAKLTLLRDAVQTLSPGGELLLYETISPDGEDREGYLRNFRALQAHWTTGLGKAGWRDALEHVTNNDLPETVANWEKLGLDAGFSRAETLFTTDDRICAMFRYT